jgi:hypothetical protein
VLQVLDLGGYLQLALALDPVAEHERNLRGRFSARNMSISLIGHRECTGMTNDGNTTPSAESRLQAAYLDSLVRGALNHQFERNLESQGVQVIRERLADRILDRRLVQRLADGEEPAHGVGHRHQRPGQYRGAVAEMGTASMVMSLSFSRKSQQNQLNSKYIQSLPYP